MTFPEVIDNSMRSSWRRCPQHFKKEYLQGLRPKGATNFDLLAGSAFAAGLETARRAFYCNHLSPDDAYALGEAEILNTYSAAGNPEPPAYKLNKAFDRVIAAFDSYWDRFPIDKDLIKIATIEGKPAIEFTFCLPLEVTHPDTGNPLLYAGRYDWTGVYGTNLLYAVDEKTTGALGPSWGSKWDLRAQFMGYVWAARQCNIPIQGTIVRGVALLKTQITHAEVIIHAQDFMIDRWHKQLLRDAAAMIAAYKTGEFDFDLADGCSAYGGCPFLELCNAPDEQPWIDLHFDSGIVWNPLGVL